VDTTYGQIQTRAGCYEYQQAGNRKPGERFLDCYIETGTGYETELLGSVVVVVVAAAAAAAVVAAAAAVAAVVVVVVVVALVVVITMIVRQHISQQLHVTVTCQGRLSKNAIAKCYIRIL
jgi:fatty acid desaturase